MSERWSHETVTRLALDACRQAGLAERPVLRFLQTHAVFALPRSGLCLRVARPGAASAARVEREAALAAVFDRRGLEALRPSDDLPPLWIDDSACVFWHWEEHDPDRTIEPRPRGALLRRVHEALEAFPGELPPWEWPVRTETGIARLVAGRLVGEDDAATLRRVLSLALEWFVEAAAGRAPTPIYGDFNPSNVVWSPTRGWVVIDYDHVGLGAREWDLVGCVYPYTSRDARRFAEGYGADVRSSPLHDPASWFVFLGFAMWRLLRRLDDPRTTAVEREADAAILDWLSAEGLALVGDRRPMLSWRQFVGAAHARMPSRGGHAPTGSNR